MKTPVLILAVPLFAFLAVAITLDLDSLVPQFPEADLTAYLVASSIAHDFDLAYTREDSDRYFRKHLVRPAPFNLVQKKLLSKSGSYKSYAAFYEPDLYPLFLAPFVRLLSYRGMMLFHVLLMASLYILAYLYYRTDDSAGPAYNAVLYYTLIPLPVLFLVPSHHLFLFASATASLFFALRFRPLLAALFLSVAFSAQPWSILLAVFIVSYWQVRRPQDSTTAATALSTKFAVFFLLGLVSVWGAESLMYPARQVSEVRRILEPHEEPVAVLWNSLPVVRNYFFGTPDVQRLVDFFFGRSTGFVIYFFTACGLLLSSVWHWKDLLTRTSLLFAVFFLIAICFTHESMWNPRYFANDFALLLAALPVFVVPLIRPVALFITVSILSCFLVGPLLVNPVGSIISRTYYAQAFPYRYFPAELSLAGRTGTTADPEFRLTFPGGKLYLLNQNFYSEHDFVWVHGESSLELLLQSGSEVLPALKIQNGSLDNRVVLRFGHEEQEIFMGPGQSQLVDLETFRASGRWFEGRFFIHGKITSESGYVPKLLSRDNPDFRFLGCQVHIVPSINANVKEENER